MPVAIFGLFLHRKIIVTICPHLNTITLSQAIINSTNRKGSDFVYEYESKKIKNHFELKDVCRKATSYFVGSFMLEMIMRRTEWENPDTKTVFIESFHKEYFAWDEKCTVAKTRNKVNLVIRIIESRMVEDALQYVIDSNDLKMDIPEAKENAVETLACIKSGKIKY